MAGLSNYLINLVLDHLVGRTASINLGGDAYVGLSTTQPVKDGTGVTEPSGNGYERAQIGFYGQSETYKIGGASAGASTSIKTIFFPKAIGAWGTCTHFAIFDHPTAGNLLAFGTLTASISPVSGNVPLVEIGALDLSIV